MNNRGMFKIIGTAVFLVVVGFLIFYFSNKESNIETPAGDVTTGNGNIVHINERGFAPKEISIKKGESITWINDRTAPAWPASARHPTHTQYPGADYDLEGKYMGSDACISEGQAKEGAFDPCRGLKKGESWTFAFTQNGTFGYHDHLNAGFTGKITVE